MQRYFIHLISKILWFFDLFFYNLYQIYENIVSIWIQKKNTIWFISDALIRSILQFRVCRQWIIFCFFLPYNNFLFILKKHCMEAYALVPSGLFVSFLVFIGAWTGSSAVQVDLPNAICELCCLLRNFIIIWNGQPERLVQKLTAKMAIDAVSFCWVNNVDKAKIHYFTLPELLSLISRGDRRHPLFMYPLNLPTDAKINPKNGGDGFSGRDKYSGWYWTPT